MLNRKIRMGLVGGGPGSFIAAVHHKAAIMDGKTELVAGAFSRDPEKSRQTGNELMLDPARVYANHQAMVAGEKALPADRRIDFVTISTPNNSHFAIARDFLAAGFHIMCEKPMTFTLDEAIELEKLVSKSGKLFGLLHNYTGYPMVKLARDITHSGELGTVRKIVVQYPQGWLTNPREQDGNMQAVWRTDPAQSGAAGSIGDIGTHAANLVEYITSLKITHICADVNTFVSGRQLDDDGNCLLKFDNGAHGLLFVSQISGGEENNLRVWIYGSKKSLEWHQEEPNHLAIKEDNGPAVIWKRGNDYITQKSAAAGRATRLPFGHPEAFIEAFANIYNNYADTLRAKLTGTEPDPLMLDFPGVHDGVRGMQFIATVLKSSKSDQKWTEMVSV